MSSKIFIRVVEISTCMATPFCEHNKSTYWAVLVRESPSRARRCNSIYHANERLNKHRSTRAFYCRQTTQPLVSNTVSGSQIVQFNKLIDRTSSVNTNKPTGCRYFLSTLFIKCVTIWSHVKVWLWASRMMYFGKEIYSVALNFVFISCFYFTSFSTI